MANVDKPKGFRPARHLTGGVIRESDYPIASAYDTDIFKGDLVKLVGGGGIEAAAADDRVVGVFAGVTFTDSRGEVQFEKRWIADTVAADAVAVVWDDPNIVFSGQQATGGSAAVGDVGGLANHVAGTGNSLTGISGHEVSGTISTATATFRILGKVDAPGNAYGEHVNLLLQIFEHELAYHGQATPGV